MAEPYQSNLGPGASATFRGATAEEAGAAIGQGLQFAGEKMDQTIHQRRELDRDQQAAEAGVQLAKISTDLDRAAIDARNNAAPGGAGHAQNIDQAIDQQSQAALANIKDPKIRARFAENYAQLKDRISTREYGWETATRVNYMAQNVDDTGTTLANGQASNPDAVGFEASLNTIHTSIDAMEGLPVDVKAKLIKEQNRKIAVAWGNGMADKDPKTLLAALDKGVLSPFLEPEDINTLRNGGQIEQRRAETEARATLAHETAAAREDLSLFKNQVGDGYVPTADEWTKKRALAVKYDLKGPEWDLDVLKDQGDVNREYRSATPAQLHHDINDLEAKGDKRSQADNVRLKHLQAFAPGAIARFNSDPYAAAAAAGNPAPELDLSNPDPAAVQQRVTWARSWASSSGMQNVPYLNNDELDVFSKRVKQGPAGQLDVTAQLRHAFGGTVAAAIVKQIDPGNKDLQLMVGMPDRVAQLYKRGVEALHDKTVALGANDQAQGQEDAQALEDLFDKFRGAIPVDLQGAVRNAARNITAGAAAEFGKSNPSGDELLTTFNQAMQRAGGRSGVATDWNAPGGFAEHSGGYVWLPSTMSSNDFVRRLSRADKATWLKAGGSAPYYQGGDGKRVPMSDAMIRHLRDYRLELGADAQGRQVPGIYSLIGPDGGHVVDQGGRPWQFDIRNLH